MSSIKLSPEHGVNPTIPICFWCGEEKNEIAMLGKIDREDSKAPKAMIFDYEPCDKCKELFDKGIQVIGITDTPIIKDMFPIVDTDSTTVYPTGCFYIAPVDWVEEFLKDNGHPEMVDEVLKSKKLLLPNDFVLSVIKEIQELESETVEDESND
jgi:hypothetical protein